MLIRQYAACTKIDHFKLAVTYCINWTALGAFLIQINDLQNTIYRSCTNGSLGCYYLISHSHGHACVLKYLCIIAC